MLALSIGLFVASWGSFLAFATCAVRSNLREADEEAAKQKRIRTFLAESKARFVELHLESGKTAKGLVHEVSEDIVTIDVRKQKRVKDDPTPSDVEGYELQEIDHLYRFDDVEDEDVDAYAASESELDTDDNED